MQATCRARHWPRKWDTAKLSQVPHKTHCSTAGMPYQASAKQLQCRHCSKQVLRTFSEFVLGHKIGLGVICVPTTNSIKAHSPHTSEAHQAMGECKACANKPTCTRADNPMLTQHLCKDATPIAPAFLCQARDWKAERFVATPHGASSSSDCSIWASRTAPASRTPSCK